MKDVETRQSGGPPFTAAPPIPEVAGVDKPFSTADLRSNLKTRSVRGGLVNLGSHGMQVAIGMGGMMVLARLLTPADFGVYAMVAVLMVFVGNFRDLGLPLATMHHESVNHREYSTLFWLYQRFNVLLMVLMIAAGPALAWFYDQPGLASITAVMAGGVFLLGLAGQHEALLKRQMRFGTLTVIDVAGTILGTAVAIASAVLGAGYWALVLQFMTLCAIKALGCWLLAGWRPSWVSWQEQKVASGIGKLLTYGRDVTAARMVNEVGRNLDRVLVGYLAGSQALGLYHYAFKWSHLPLKQIFAPLHSVAVTGLSRVQHEPAVYREYARRALLPAFSVAMPALAFIFADAANVVGVLLGSQWVDAVPLLRILSIAAFIGTLNTVTKWFYFSSGQTRRQLQWSAISTTIMVISVATGAAWGVHGIAIGFTTGACLLAYPGVWFCLRGGVLLRVRDFVAIVWRPAVAASAAAIALIALQRVLIIDRHPAVVMPVHLLIFSVLYAAFWMAPPGGIRAVREVIQLARTARGVRPSPAAGAAE